MGYKRRRQSQSLRIKFKFVKLLNGFFDVLPRTHSFEFDLNQRLKPSIQKLFFVLILIFPSFVSLFFHIQQIKNKTIQSRRILPSNIIQQFFLIKNGISISSCYASQSHTAAHTSHTQNNLNG